MREVPNASLIDGHRAHADSTGRRNGVTLIELLVVMLIVMVVSGMTMTVTAPALQSRKIREAARIVEIMVNKGRNRALQTGRPAGLWIERMPSLSEASVSLALAEVPEPYIGDYPASKVSLATQGFGGSSSAPGPTEYLLVVKPAVGRTPELWLNPDPTVQQAVRAGDQIQFGGIGPNYVLLSSESHRYAADIKSSNGGYPVFYVARKLRQFDDTTSRYRYDINGFYIHNWFRNGGGGTNEFGDTTDVSYRISRQPIKSAGGSVALPSGAVVDLNFSGTKRLSFHPRVDPNYSDPTQGGNRRDDLKYGRPPNQYTGQNWFWSTAPSVCSPPQWSLDKSPVIIMFTPDGVVERMYARYWDPSFYRGSNSGSWEWGTIRVNEMIYLLVGKREKVPAPLTLNDQDKANWTDPENLWIAINSSTGFIGTAQNAAVPADVQVTGLRGHNSTFADIGASSAPPNEAIYTSMNTAQRPMISGMDHLGFGARRIVAMQQIMGGK